jgi:hypothetical protein
MQTKPFPEIEASELEAVRRFLTSVRDEERRPRAARIPLDSRGGVTVRNGITRARTRTVGKSTV